MRGGVHAFYSIESRTDAQGRFVFDRVMPGPGEVSRVLVTDFGNASQQHMGCWQEPVTVVAGQTAEVKIGGKGRAVVGRVALESSARHPRRLAPKPPGDDRTARGFNPLAGLFGQDPHQNDRFAATLDKDGRFRVEDVPRASTS